jgi:DNA polymerase I-like protein with 3'-5' exonuclease and polymerase domains
MNIPKPKKGKDKNGNKVLVSAGLRDLFRARAGEFLVECDYSALESYIIAIVSGDRQLLEWHNTPDFDIHKATAALFFGIPQGQVTDHQRSQAKTIRYAFQYGARPETAWKRAVIDFPDVTLHMMDCRLP